MNYVYIGEIVNTHGIKGELRIISDFQYKKQVFVPGMILYVGTRKQKVVLNSYRVHKNYDMVTFEGIVDINNAVIFKGDSVYVDREDLVIDGYVNEDIIGLDVYDVDRYIGKVEKITNNTVQEILVVKHEHGRYMIPFISEFVKDVDIEQKKIVISSIEGLLNDN